MSEPAMQVNDASVRYTVATEPPGVPAGYKRTEVGVIPEDWTCSRLSADILLLSGHHVLAKYCNQTGEGTPYLTGPADFPDGHIAQTKFTTKPAALCQAGDILITVKGSGSGALVVADAEYCISRQLMAMRPTSWNSYFLLCSLRQNASRIRAASTGLIPGLSRSDILDQPLPLPTAVSEQYAIAEALSDVDRLLGALESLIAKKRAIKQAAMQQLLTRKTRLPGFSGDWETKRLGLLCSMKSGEGITAKNIDEQSPFPCYGGNGLRGYAAGFTHDGCYCLIGRVGALCGNVMLATGKFFASEHAIVVTSIDHVDIRWLTVVLETLELNRRAESSAQPVLTVSKLLPLEVSVPPTRGEQTAIATVLSDMDAEIESLERRRDKTRAIKQGMMQQLLTGRVRLVEPTADGETAS